MSLFRLTQHKQTAKWSHLLLSMLAILVLPMSTPQLPHYVNPHNESNQQISFCYQKLRETLLCQKVPHFQSQLFAKTAHQTQSIINFQVAFKRIFFAHQPIRAGPFSFLF